MQRDYIEKCSTTVQAPSAAPLNGDPSSPTKKQKLDKVFENKTTEKDRPSLLFSPEVTEADKANKDLLVSQRVRNHHQI